MTTTPTLKEALALALKLEPKERLQLIEQVASSVEYEIETQPATNKQASEHWGHSLNRLLDEGEPIEFLYPEIEDPIEWVRHLRSEELRHRLGDWGSDE